MGNGSRLKRIYRGMKARCYNSNTPGYANYGGRGIRVCDEWFESFQNFERWSMDNGYADDLSIDRINVNGDYEPTNCRWSDPKVQCNNKRHYWLPNEETDFVYNQSPNVDEQEAKRNEVKNKLRKLHLTQVWLINQLRMRDLQTDKTEMSSVLAGTRVGAKSEYILDLSLNILVRYQTLFTAST